MTPKSTSQDVEVQVMCFARVNADEPLRWEVSIMLLVVSVHNMSSITPSLCAHSWRARIPENRGTSSGRTLDWSTGATGIIVHVQGRLQPARDQSPLCREELEQRNPGGRSRHYCVNNPYHSNI